MRKHLQPKAELQLSVREHKTTIKAKVNLKKKRILY